MIKTHKAIVKKRTETPNKYGSEVISYEDFGRVRGFMDYYTIMKNQVAQKFVEDTTHMFICETKLAIEQGDRFFVNDTEYEVNFVDRPHFGKLAQIELKKTLHQNNMIKSLIYFGVSPEDNLIETDVLAFEKQDFDSKSFSKEISVDEGNLFIVYPKTYGKSSIRLNHKPITDWKISELMIDGSVHYVYKTSIKANDKIFIELF